MSHSLETSLENLRQKPLMTGENAKAPRQGTVTEKKPENHNVELHNNWKEYVCGGGAALCNTVITFPLFKVIFRQMIHGVETTHAYEQIRREGLWYLYRGLLPPVLQRTVSMSLMFGVYDASLHPLLKHDVNPICAKTIAGIVAGTVEATLAPFERIQTLLIHPKYHKELKNTVHAAKHIAKFYGVIEFYRGLVPILFRNGPCNAGFFIIRDELNNRLPKQENAFYKGLQNFICGASIGAFLSTVYYPVSVIKISMQSQLGGPHESMVSVFKKVLRERDSKVVNIYHGSLLNITRAFISWGIINTSYEIFRKILYA